MAEVAVEQPFRLAGAGETGVPLWKVAAARVGVIKSSRVLAFVVEWAIARQALGRSPTVEEYADYWARSLSTAYRRQALFRSAFPGQLTPDLLLDVVEVEWDRRRGAAGLGTVPIGT